MSVLELTLRGSDKVIAHACGVCHVVARSREDAERCCAPRLCSECGGDMGNSFCRPCANRRIADAEAKQYEKATKIHCSDYSGPLYADGIPEGDWGDGYFSDEDALRGACEQEGIEVPAYAWACSPRKLELDAKDVLESAADDHYEGALDRIPNEAIDELGAYLSAWCERHPVTSWYADHGRAVVLRSEGA